MAVVKVYKSLKEIYGLKNFLKIRPLTNIEQIQFAFVDKENPTKNFDCYLNFVEFGSFFIACIKNNTFRQLWEKSKEEQKAKSANYASVFYSSPQGFGEIEVIDKNRKKKNIIVGRSFTIAPGNKTELVFCGKLFPALIENGAYKQEANKSPLSTITIGCSFKDLDELAYTWGFFEATYMTQKFHPDSMFEEIDTEKENKRANKHSTQCYSTQSTPPSIKEPESQNNASTSTNKQASVQSTAQESEPILRNCKSSTPLVERQTSPGDYSMQVIDTDSKTYNVVFKADEVNKIGKSRFTEFLDRCASTNGCRFCFKYELTKENNRTILLFKGFTK